MSDGMSEAFRGTYHYDRSKIDKIGKEITIREYPKITAIVGDVYIGLGYSGLSDGVEITGKLIEYNRKLDSVTLKDSNGEIHAVIPTTLKKT